jgi:hypothetical protein
LSIKKQSFGFSSKSLSKKLEVHACNFLLFARYTGAGAFFVCFFRRPLIAPAFAGLKAEGALKIILPKEGRAVTARAGAPCTWSCGNSL